MVRVLFLILFASLTSQAMGQASIVNRPIKGTAIILGGLAAGGVALHCAARSQCVPPKLKELMRAKLDRTVQQAFDYIPAPKDLPGLPGAVKVPGKDRNSAGKLRPRWDLPSGDFAEWDSQHGEVEIYDKRGKHKGVVDPKTGAKIKPAVPGRRAST